MTSEEAARDFRFKSSLVPTIIARLFGLALIWVSWDFLAGWARPTWERLPYMLLLLPFGLLICFAGVFFMAATRDVEIAAGQLRFRRFFAWNSVPLESVSKIGLLPAPAVYVRGEHEGKRYRIIFSPHRTNWWEPRGPSVVNFLRELARNNAARRQAG